MEALRALQGIISEGVNETIQVYSANGLDFPSLNDPYVSTPLEEQLRVTTNLTIAAAEQLIAMLRSPGISLMEATGGVSVLPPFLSVLLTL
jgi:hypothetical protein